MFAKSLPACLTAFLLAVVALGADEAPSVQVVTVALRQQELGDVVTAYGTVSISEEGISNISFPHAGQITELNIHAGQKVHTGEPLVTITADPAALQSYEKALAALKFAKGELARQKRLLAQHLVTNAQVATAEQALTDATVTLETERKLGNDRPTEVAVAPFDGYVAQLTAAPGDRLQANTAIIKLARTDQGVRITVGLKPEDAGRVVAGMSAQVTPIFLSKSQPLAGTVSQVSGTINATTKLIDAWIDISQSAKLIPGTAVSAVINLSRHEGWVVPRSAVLRVDVNTGIETNQLTEVAGGFDPSLKVVTLGNYELREGMAVREAESATSP